VGAEATAVRVASLVANGVRVVGEPVGGGRVRVARGVARRMATASGVGVLDGSDVAVAVGDGVAVGLVLGRATALVGEGVTISTAVLVVSGVSVATSNELRLAPARGAAYMLAKPTAYNAVTVRNPPMSATWSTSDRGRILGSRIRGPLKAGQAARHGSS
jgi:hypothetical protein